MSDDQHAFVARRSLVVKTWAAALTMATTLGIVSGVTSPQAAAASDPVTRTNYNALGTGWRPDTFWRPQAKADDRIAYVPDPLGQRGIVQRIEVLPGDTNVFRSSSKGERADVIRQGAKQGDMGGFVDGQTIVMSWSTLIGSNFASPPGDWNIFANTHTAGGSTQSPWQLNLSGDEARFRMRLFGGGRWKEELQPPDATKEWFDFGPLPKNQWHDFVAQVTFGCTGKGVARLWMDGKQLVDAVDRKIGYCGDPGLYWKQGFYRSAYDKPTQLWFADTFRWKTVTDALAHYGWTGHR